MAGRHPTILPREECNREGVQPKAVWVGEEALREEGEKIQQLECWRHPDSDPWIT